jgi:flagellum-specific peptidoglycan hydrolase FlgJ
VPSLPNPSLSRAVIIGVGDYSRLRELPAVHRNLIALREVLCADQYWGLPSNHCALVDGPKTAAEMLDPVLEAACGATDTLLLYYAGHGLVDRRGGLNLTLVGSDPDPQRMYTSVPYVHVRDALLDSRASRRIVILDCCYSGRALGQMSNPVSSVADEASAEGTYVLAATAENKTALAPPGQEFTAFTGELLNIAYDGIRNCGPLLDLDSIFQHLLAIMRAKGFPDPQKRDRNTAGQLTLIRNQAFRLHTQTRRWQTATQTSVAENSSVSGDGAPRATMTALPQPGTAAQQTFIYAVAPGAIATQAKYRVPAAVTIAQAIGHSGWGRSYLATKNHNLFAIKGTGPAGSDLLPTQQYENGQWVTIDAPFRVYNNFSESIEDHGELLATSGYYWHAMSERSDPDAFANALTGVYDTNPEYGSELIQLMHQYDLYRYDTGTAAGSRASPTAAYAGTTSIPRLPDAIRPYSRLSYSAPSADGPGPAEPRPEGPASFGRITRNSPCPCGSGRKFKQCHGDPRNR